ncbi:hypothetical protein [Sphingomonas faeni]|uniref:hypothetical protein n=1 Tax=Sphingomonas faeni TaxID=185950 RepID=UPI00336268BA
MILFAIALQAAPPTIIDWQPFPIQRTPDGGLYDRTSATRSGDIVNTWIRFVNMELKGVNEAGEQTDSHMEVDCRKPRMKMLAFRVVRRDGTILKSTVSGPSELGWHIMRIGMRGYDIRAGICSRVR